MSQKNQETKGTPKKDQESVEELNKMVQTLMNDLTGKIKEIWELNQKNKQLEEDIKKYKGAIDEAQSYKNKLDDLLSGISKIQQENEQLRSEGSEQDKEIKRLRAEGKKLKETRRQLEQKDKDLQNLQKELNDIKNLPKETAIKNLEDQVNVLQNSKNELDKEISVKEAQIKTSLEEYKKLQTDYKTFRDNSSETERNLKEANEDLGKKIKETEDELHDLKKELKKLKEENINLGVVRKRLLDDIDSLKEQKDQIKVEMQSEIDYWKEKSETSTATKLSDESLTDVYIDSFFLSYLKNSIMQYQSILEYTLVNFNSLFLSVFGNGGRSKIANCFSIEEIHFKDLVLFIIVNLNQNSNSVLDNNFGNKICLDFLTKSPYVVYKKEENYEEYMKGLGNVNLTGALKTKVLEVLKTKITGTKNQIFNNLFTIINKIIASISNNVIEIQQKTLLDLKDFHDECLKLTKTNKGCILTIDNSKLTDFLVEYILCEIKYFQDPITQCYFVGPYNFENIKEESILHLFFGLLKYVSFLSISVKGCGNFNHHILGSLMFVVSQLRDIRVIGFENCDLKEGYVQVIGEYLKNHKTIIGLLLSKNNIDSNGAFYLANCLSENKSLTTLILSGNKISNNGLRALMTVLSTKNRKITVLNLSQNNLSSDDFKSISEFLNTNPHLNNLDISGNPLEMQGCVELGVAFSNAKQIKALNLSSMNISQDTSGVILSSLSAEDISLDNNPLSDIGMIMFCKALNTNCKRISVKNIDLSSIGLTHLINTVKNFLSLEELHLEENKLDSQGIDTANKFCQSKSCKVYLSKSMVPEEVRDRLHSNIILV